MAAHSETYFLRKYEDAFSNPDNIEALVSLFTSSMTTFDGSLLAKVKVVTHEEWREIEQSSKGRYSQKREKQSRSLINKVIGKQNLMSFRGFRAFAKREAQKSHQTDLLLKVFPFGDEEDVAGLVSRLVPRAAAAPTVTPSRSNTPTVLWVTLSQREHDIVKQSLSRQYHLNTKRTSTKHGFLCEEITLTAKQSLHDSVCGITLFLAFPASELMVPSPFKQLLMNFDPRPHLAVMTGACLPLPQSSIQINQSDVVVVTCTDPLPIEGEVQYLTELWNLKGELTKMFSHDGNQFTPHILFGRATNTMGQGRNDYTVHCPRAMQFYSAAKEVEGMEFLSVVQVDDVDGAQVEGGADTSTALYVYEIILNIIELL